MSHDLLYFCFVVDDDPTTLVEVTIGSNYSIKIQQIKECDYRKTSFGNSYFTDYPLEGEVMLQPVNIWRADSVDS